MPRKTIPTPIGQRFGSLVILGDVEGCKHRKVRVKCDCGKEEDKYLTCLLTGKQNVCSDCSSKKREKDLEGQRFGRLVALSGFYKTGKTGRVRKAWKCLCDCGNFVFPTTDDLTTGNTQGCGHDCKMLVHPLRGSPTEVSWQKMISRVRGHYNNVKDSWKDVAVADRWNPEKGGSFENFAEDMGKRPEGCTLNRIQGAKIYSKETCEWATLSLQSFDQRRSRVNTSGRTGVYQETKSGKWIANISKEGEVFRLYYGDSFEEACEAREKVELELYGFTKE